MAAEASTFDPTQAAEVLFLPLAGPERRRADPLRALSAARDLEMILGSGRESLFWRLVGPGTPGLRSANGWD